MKKGPELAKPHNYLHLLYQFRRINTFFVKRIVIRENISRVLQGFGSLAYDYESLLTDENPEKGLKQMFKRKRSAGPGLKIMLKRISFVPVGKRTTPN